MNFVTDHLESVRMLVNAQTGEIIHTVEYDAWGVITSETGDSTLQHFRFAGGLDMDGWYKFGARYYDPANGRWTQKDPILFAGGDVNLYGYVMNDPVNWVDPYGLAKVGFQAGIHIPAVPGPVSYGGTMSSTLDWSSSSILGFEISLTGDGVTGEAVLGSIFDVGVAVGITDLSDTDGKCAGKTVSFGLGKYMGLQLTFRNDFNIWEPQTWIPDGISIGLGWGLSTPVDFTIPGK